MRFALNLYKVKDNKKMVSRLKLSAISSTSFLVQWYPSLLDSRRCSHHNEAVSKLQEVQTRSHPANRENVYDWKRIYFWCRCRLFNFTNMEFSSAYLHWTEFSRYGVFSCIFRIFLFTGSMRSAVQVDYFQLLQCKNMSNFVFLSLVFDADGENHEAYQEIHNKYKEMVRIIYWLCLRRFIPNIEA